MNFLEEGVRSTDAFLFTIEVFNLDMKYGVAVAGNMYPGYAIQKVLR